MGASANFQFKNMTRLILRENMTRLIYGLEMIRYISLTTHAL